jgi:hypothetical protein
LIPWDEEEQPVMNAARQRMKRDFMVTLQLDRKNYRTVGRKARSGWGRGVL